MRAALAILAATLSLAAPARAATFTAERLTDGRVAIHMRGIIEYGDQVKAAAARQAAPTASLFLLNSPGGNVFSSIEIGRLNTLPAEVRTGEECASACAMIWASARERYIEPGAMVGFHGVSRTVNGSEQLEPQMNAEVAAYYSRLGFSEEAIRIMTSAPPTGMRWINDLDAAHGIAFAPRQTTSGTPISTAPAPRDTPQQATTDPWPQPKRVGTFEVHSDGSMIPTARHAELQGEEVRTIPAPKAAPKVPEHAKPALPEIHF